MTKSLPLLTALAAIIAALLPLPPGQRSAVAEEGRGEGELASGSPTADAAPISLPSQLKQLPNPSASETPPGDQLLQQVAAHLERRASVTAKLRHQVSLAGQQLYGVGNYWQQGSGEELKVRLELQIAGQDAQLLQVCNSRHMWVDRKLPTGRHVTRIDLRQLRADPSLGAPDLSDVKPGQANWSPLQSELIAYSGGLPSLVSSLSENFTFLPPQAMRLAMPPLTPEPTNVSVFAVVGHWRPERLAAILSKTQPKVADAESEEVDGQQPRNAQIPERIPREVLLLVGQADMFPYRIEYRGLETPDSIQADGPAIPYQLSVHPTVVLEFSDIAFDAQIPPGQFDFIVPGDADIIDQTSAILDRLRQQHQQQVATRTDSTPPTR
jgi:hypothetical protein